MRSRELVMVESITTPIRCEPLRLCCTRVYWWLMLGCRMKGFDSLAADNYPRILLWQLCLRCVAYLHVRQIEPSGTSPRHGNVDDRAGEQEEHEFRRQAFHRSRPSGG